MCREFLAPKHIDPKFLDPKHVFKDVSSLPASITEPEKAENGNEPATQASTSHAAAAAARLASSNHAHANVYAPEKKRRQRDGYADGDYTLFHAATASDFVRIADPVHILGTMNKIEFVTDEEKEWLKSRHTTPDVIANFEDLKVLGKKDFKMLMKWRLAIRLEIGLDVKKSVADEATEEVEVEPIDEEEQISEEVSLYLRSQADNKLKKLHDEKMAKQKREKRKKNEMKTRTIQKLQLGMTAPTDLDMDDRALAGEEMFDLGEGERELERAGGHNIGDVVRDADGMSDSEDEASAEVPAESDDEVLSSDEEREMRTRALEGELDNLYDDYKDRMSERDAKWKVKQMRLKDRNYDKWQGISKEGSDSDDGVDKGFRDGIVRQPRRGDADEEEEESEGEGGWDVVAAQKAKLDDDSSDDSDADEEAKPKAKRPITIRPDARAPEQPKRLLTSLTGDDARARMSRQAQVWFDQGVFKDVGDLAALDGDDESEADDESEENDEDDEMDEDEDEEEESDVEMESRSSTLGEDDDDFEIVPQEEDNDREWDVEDEDQDEVLQEQIKSTSN